MRFFFFKNIIFILFILLSSKYTLSQSNLLNIQHYKIKDGLSQNYTTDICQDKFGYIWIGTQDGLNRFDGYDFKIYRQNPSDKQSLSDNYTIDIYASSDSLLWVINNNGLEVFNHKTDKFQNILKNKQSKNSTYSINIKALTVDNKGVVWLRTADGIIEYNPQKNDFFEYKLYPDGNLGNNIFNIYKICDDGANLWTGSSEGLVKFNKNSKVFTKYKINTSNSTTNHIYTVFCSNKNQIWAATSDKLYVFNTKTEKFKLIKSKTKFNQIQSVYVSNFNSIKVGTLDGFYIKTSNTDFYKVNLEDYIYDEINIGNISHILEDHSGITWISTDYGVFKIDSKKTRFELYRKDKNNKLNFSSNTVYSIYHDVKKDVIWFGTRGRGINAFYRQTGSVIQYSTQNSNLKSNLIYCIKKDPSGNLWVGTQNGPFIFSPKKNDFIPFQTKSSQKSLFQNNRLNDILFDNKRIWFATYKGLFKYENDTLVVYSKKDFENSIVDNQVFKIIKRSSNQYWIATLYGLSKFNPETQKFTNYTHDNNKISNNIATTVFESSDSVIWVGTGTGLNKYIPEKDSFVFYTSQSHGFSNDFIYTITEDENKNLWLSTNRGIIKFNPKTNDVINYSIEDNLQDYEFNIGAIYKDNHNEVFWGGINGINSIKLNQVKKNTYTPKPLITHFFKHTKHGTQEIYLTKNNIINLAYTENSFDIRFAVPEFTFPAKNKFKYRIKEFSNEWTDLGNNNFINFFQLTPGTYTFQVIGANSDNNWNINPTTVIINISTPWWQTSSAYIIYIIVFLGMLGGGFLIYNKEIRKENRILHEKQIVAKEVEKQKELLAVKNNSIAESMRYASGIINALLPTKEQFRKIVPDSFVLFLSKEIVSGDFYWIEETEEKTFIAAVDCTGHGVPGAFMSIIGLDLLRNITESGVETPSKILDQLNRGIYTMFRNEKEGHKLKDGMDLSLIAIHKYKNIIEFAGAMNQMYIIRDDTITEIKGDRFSVSPINYLTYGSFTNHVINVEKNDMIYLFSDGYVDQFGGPDDKKFKYRRFRHMLLNNYEKPVKQQKDILKRIINTWRGTQEQIDDILVIGVRIHNDF